MIKFLHSAFFILFTPIFIFSQNFYAIDTIQKIEIYFQQANWDYILDTAKQGSDTYTLAQWVKINGVQFDSVGVKYKGNSSYNPNNVKNPLHIELDHFKTQDYLGTKDIKLSNGYNDPSFVREVMLYELFQKYGEASHANFAQGYINGTYMGLYTNVEAVTNTFLEDRFFSNSHTFVFGDNGGCDLRYKGNDSTFYYVPYTMKSDFGWTDLMHLCDSLSNNINGMENILDVDRTLWHLAYTNATVTLDSYLGNLRHNYYIYEDHNGRFNPILWDLNGGFGVFSKPDNGPQLTVPQLQVLTPILHASDSLWPLVKNILAVPMYKRMYIAHMKTIMSENFSNNTYYSFVQKLQAIADTAVQSDPNKFGTYSQFLANLDTTVILGPKTVPGISYLMAARDTFLSSTVEFQQVAPVISGIASSDTFPLINTSVFITATVSNAATVTLGLRNNIMQRFTRKLMYDDGFHGDGASADGIYGISVSVSAPEIQYYVYAENNNAGIFSPDRAEHDYFTLDADYAGIQTGEVVINEIMAINNTTIQNANGIYGDWIELYNTTSNPVSLDFLNLSDDVTNSGRWQFPSGLTIPPNGFFVVWADNDTSSSEVHCDFGFSGNGEQAILSYSNGSVVDSVGFPAQIPDITYGKYPNGSGPFVSMPPTFQAVNSLTGVEENINENDIHIFPNPSNGTLTVQCATGEVQRIVLRNVFGEIVYEDSNMNSIPAKRQTHTLPAGLASGIYFLEVECEKDTLLRKIILNR